MKFPNHIRKYVKIDSRSYSISKRKGVSRMVSAFKDYSSRGLCLQMTDDELTLVNKTRKHCQYKTHHKLIFSIVERQKNTTNIIDFVLQK